MCGYFSRLFVVLRCHQQQMINIFFVNAILQHGFILLRRCKHVHVQILGVITRIPRERLFVNLLNQTFAIQSQQTTKMACSVCNKSIRCLKSDWLAAKQQLLTDNLIGLLECRMVTLTMGYVMLHHFLSRLETALSVFRASEALEVFTQCLRALPSGIM